jgi:aryl-alcohol dehydrogenase-like predicted oxidoreductase
MRYQLFGTRTGLKVSSIALGTGLLGKVNGYGAEPDDVPRILGDYAEGGGNFIDTSDAYQLGESEKAVGKFIASRRNEMVIASKFGRGATVQPGIAASGASRKAMVQSVEDSLRRLQTDRIDLYFAHLDDGVTPMEEIARGFDDLVRAGKIVYGGLSNFPAWRAASGITLAASRGWAPIVSVQVEFSLLARDAQRELLPMADAFGLGVMGYSPLAAGLLTGKYRDGERGRATDLTASVTHSAAEHAHTIDTLLAVASELGITAGCAALAWVQAKGVIPIIGPRTPTQLAENLMASSVALSESQIQRLDKASAVPPGYPHELLSKQRPAFLAGIEMPHTTVG